MKTRENEKHIIDIVFVLALFALFAFSALALVILGADIYKGVVDRMENNYAERTESSYIVEKIRTYDEEGNVSVGTLNGHDAVILSRTYGDRQLCTYLYEYNGSLCELYTDPSYGLSEADGTPIYDVKNLTIAQLDNGLVHIAFDNESTGRTDLYVHVRTEK